MNEREPIHRPEPPDFLPRTWNKRLLPEYLVIAVDERDPECPGAIVSNPAEKPNYPDRTPLLRDHHYVRFQRLALEMGFYEMHGKATPRVLADVFSVSLPDNDEPKPSLWSLIREDYQFHPHALLDKLN